MLSNKDDKEKNTGGYLSKENDLFRRYRASGSTGLMTASNNFGFRCLWGLQNAVEKIWIGTYDEIACESTSTKQRSSEPFLRSAISPPYATIVCQDDI